MPRYRLVLETLEPLPADRKCFRMINGVLVERKVGEVMPLLKTNSEGLKKVLEDLLKQYRTQQEDMEKWKVWSTALILAVRQRLILVTTEKAQCPGCTAINDLCLQYLWHSRKSFRDDMSTQAGRTDAGVGTVQCLHRRGSGRRQRKHRSSSLHASGRSYFDVGNKKTSPSAVSRNSRRGRTPSRVART